jgi:NAD-dependent SIR2 family protein deacetylase
MYCLECGNKLQILDLKKELLDDSDTYQCTSCGAVWDISGGEHEQLCMRMAYVNEDLVCINCTFPAGSKEGLLPVISRHGEVYGVACVHTIDKLKYWRRLTPEENAEFQKASGVVVNAIMEASARTQRKSLKAGE